MGCFFGCFRVRDDHRRPHLVSDSTRSKPTEAVVSKNRLSSLFLSEEKEDSVYNDVENNRSGSPQINKDLVDEAKFLKACGTLPETPSEIRKASKKLKALPPGDKDCKSTDFHPWLPNTSINREKQIEELPTPIKLFEKWATGSVSSDFTPNSCISNVQPTGRISISSVEDGETGSVRSAVKIQVDKTDNIITTPCISATDLPWKNKAVRFECNLDSSSSKGSSSENGCHILRKFDSPGELNAPKPSPKPTPLKLSDEMHTPGTVFPSNIEVLASGKPRIRSQYVYPVFNPVENVSQWKVLQEDDSSSLQRSSQLNESFEHLENSTPKSEVEAREASFVQELKVDGSLASWLKPPKSAHDDDYPNDASRKNFHFGRTPMDRPIIGIVAAHWNENEPSHIPPKWWDGNGIPNSTNKYKEDQKVSWHATPFEERLEKALSEESSISQKKQIEGRPIAYDEHEERDTALSKLQAATHSKSVVSF